MPTALTSPKRAVQFTVGIPDLAILHTDFNTVVTGILSENEEIDCTVTNGFSAFFVFIPSYDDGRLFHAATPDTPPAHPAKSLRSPRCTMGLPHCRGGRYGPSRGTSCLQNRRHRYGAYSADSRCPYRSGDRIFRSRHW